MIDCDYYLHMEDDILAPPNWDAIVLGTVKELDQAWSCNGPPM